LKNLSVPDVRRLVRLFELQKRTVLVLEKRMKTPWEKVRLDIGIPLGHVPVGPHVEGWRSQVEIQYLILGVEGPKKRNYLANFLLPGLYAFDGVFIVR
jgi:hypothetical protein